MFLFYLILCYFTNIPKSASYVMIAANIDDFGALAKKFMPENKADEILATDTNLNLRAKEGYDSIEFNVKTEENQLTSRTYSKSKKRINKIKHELNLNDIIDEVKERLRNELASMAANINKKKKKSKNVSDRETTLTTKSPIRNKIDLTDLTKAEKKTNAANNLQGRYLKQSRYDKDNESRDKKHNKKHVKALKPDSRYVAEVFVAPPPKYLHKEKKISSLQTPNVQNKLKQSKYSSDEVIKKENQDRERFSDEKRNERQKYKIRPVKRKKQLIIRDKKQRKRNTTQESTTSKENLIRLNEQDKVENLFEIIDMINKNDSYEDYATPKKDYSSEEKINTKLNKKNNYKKFSDLWLPSTRKHKDDLIVKDQFDTLKYKNNNKKKIFTADNDKPNNNNANKKKRIYAQKQNIHNQSNLKRQHGLNVPIIAQIPHSPMESNQDIEHAIETYAQQLKKATINEDDNDETQRTVTEELKARTESIAFVDENNQKLSNDKNMKLVTNRKINRSFHLPKSGTVIPKRDFYKFSSPNYLAKLPIIGEKYKFNEPIPEEDREPEVLKPIGNPLASINGKVLLT